MGPKYKVTGCARFFLFLVLFVPAVFFGAAYFRDENGVQIIKDFYHSIVGGSAVTKEAEGAKEAEEAEKAKDEEIKRLKEEIEEKDKEIEKLKSGGQ
jgi:cell division protein FtsB